jgi:type IV pilus assembly protein PilC
MRKLNLEESYMICSQLSMILTSGFPIDVGIKMIEEELQDNELKEIIHQIIVEFDETMNFAQAVKNSKAFDKYMEHMVYIGEESGHLDDVMTSLADYYLKMNEIEHQYKSALTYPAILMLMMLVVVGIIAFKVLPIFKNVLNSLGSDLTTLAKLFMNFGQIFSIIAFIILLFLAITIIVLYLINKIKPEKQIENKIIQKVLNKKMNYSISQAQLTYALSLFLSSGYDLAEAMKYLPEVIDDKVVKDKLLKCKEDIEKGENFEDSVKKYKLYEGMYLNMIQVGFKTGQGDTVMKKLTELYEQEVYLSISKFLNIVEPSIVIVLSVIVGVVLLSVLLPLVSIMASL